MVRRVAVVALLIAVILAGAVQAQMPPLPHSFYGSVVVNGEPAPVGAVVEARGQGVLTGIPGNPIEVTQAGRYGGRAGLAPKLVVQGQVADGTPIEFYVDGARARCARPGEPWQETYPYKAGEITELGLLVGEAEDIPDVAPTSTPTPPGYREPTPTRPPTHTPTPGPSATPTASPAPTNTLPAASATPTPNLTSSPTAPAPQAAGPATATVAAREETAALIPSALPPTATPTLALDALLWATEPAPDAPRGPGLRTLVGVLILVGIAAPTTVLAIRRRRSGAG